MMEAIVHVVCKVVNEWSLFPHNFFVLSRSQLLAGKLLSPHFPNDETAHQKCTHSQSSLDRDETMGSIYL